MACDTNTTGRLRQNLKRIGFNLSCSVGEADIDPDPEMTYYLCKLTGNHAYLPNVELQRTHYGLILYASTIVILIGIIVNALSIAVLARERRYSSSVFLLQVLAVCDIVFLVLNLFNFCIPAMILSLSGPQCNINTFLALMVNSVKSSVHIGRIVSQILQSCKILAVGMMLIVSVDRYIAIFYPLHARHLCNFQAARRMILALTLYSLAWFGLFVVFNHVNVPMEVKNRAFAASTIINLIIPALVVFILNCRLIKSLHESRKIQKEMRGQASERRVRYKSHSSDYFALTSKLVGIASLFLVCVLPSIIVAVNYILVVEWRPDCCLTITALSMTNMVAILLMNVSSAANFFMYMITGWRFRKALYTMLFGRCCPKNPKNEGYTTNGVTRSTVASTQL